MTTETGIEMRQVAPYPTVLHDLVERLAYRPGWRFVLKDMDRGQGSEGLTLDIITTGYQSYHPPALAPNQFGPGEESLCEACGEPFPCPAYKRWDSDAAPREPYRVHHYMPVPPAAYDERSWRRWLFEQCLLVERHEAMEFFRIDGGRPFAPHHGPGNDCYLVFDHGTDEDVRTSYKGEIKPKE